MRRRSSSSNPVAAPTPPSYSVWHHAEVTGRRRQSRLGSDHNRSKGLLQTDRGLLLELQPGDPADDRAAHA